MLPFITAYDPLGGSSGSIDPLGALQTYGLLADLLLPGVTTITTRSRYLSMLCAALANAEKYHEMLPGASGLAQRRKAVEPFERLWALACVVAQENDYEGAADGLRGITYVEKIYHHFANSGNNVNCDFQLLKFQSRTGAVGTYWTTMVGGQLVHADSGALTAEGIEIAECFPKLRLESKDQAKLANPESAHRVSLPLKDLHAWSKQCHLKAASDTEHHLLGEALTADDRRECISQALAMMADKIPGVWVMSDLKRLAKKLTTLPKAVELGLPVVIDAIVVTEQFHEAVLRAFETLLWWGTENAGKPLEGLIVDSDFRKASDLCLNTAQKLSGFRERCERPDVRDAIESVAGFSFKIGRCHSERDVVTELLDRHHRVQSGKVDGGMPKRDWIGWDSTALLRPSPRFQRKDRPALAAGLSLTHPYRFEPFVFMLRENGVLTQN
jgi:hypothetical protein